MAGSQRSTVTERPAAPNRVPAERSMPTASGALQRLPLTQIASPNDVGTYGSFLVFATMLLAAEVRGALWVDSVKGGPNGFH